MSTLPDEFEVDVEARGQDLWVLPRGDLDLLGAPEMGDALRLALASDAGAIVVDLRGLELLDSTGLRVLLEAQAGEGGDRMSFVAGSERIQGVLHISGLLDELPFRVADD
jgi:anti-anti-sigma factor